MISRALYGLVNYFLCVFIVLVTIVIMTVGAAVIGIRQWLKSNIG